MEENLENVLSDVMSQPETVGCLLINRQGLPLGARGKINPNMSGMSQAIAEVASKLEPNLNPPTICIYSKRRRCIIQKQVGVTAVILKQST